MEIRVYTFVRVILGAGCIVIVFLYIYVIIYMFVNCIFCYVWHIFNVKSGLSLQFVLAP